MAPFWQAAPVAQRPAEGVNLVLALILLALLVLVLFGAGFAVHVLWWVAVVAAVLLLVGFVTRSGGRRTW